MICGLVRAKTPAPRLGVVVAMTVVGCGDGMLIGLDASGASSLDQAVILPTRGVLDFSANDNMHFAWYNDQRVSAGSSDDLDRRRQPYAFKLARGYGLDDLIGISSNDNMHFAWYRDGKVSAGSSDNLASKRKPYRFRLANGYKLSDVIAFSANDNMHFAWYRDGKVSAGSSDNLASKRKPYSFTLAPGYKLSDVIAFSANDNMHFAWYRDGKVSAGSSDDLDRRRAPYFFDLAEDYSIVEWNLSLLSFEYEALEYPSDQVFSDILALQRFNNASPATITQTFAHTVERSATFEWSLSQSLMVGTEVSLEAGIPFGSASVTSRIELTVESSQTWSETKTQTFEIASTVAVPPFSALDVTWTVDFADDLVVPFFMDFEVAASQAGQPLAPAEIIAALQAEGFDGTVIGRNNRQSTVTVRIRGEFRGAYGLETRLDAIQPG